MDMLVCSADGDDGTANAGGGGDGDEAVKKLTAKVDELLGEKKKLAEKVRSFEAAEAERKAKEAEAEEEAARKAKDWEKIENGYKEKLSRAEGDGLVWRSRYEALVIDRGLDEALASSKINPALAKAAHALIKAEYGIELSEDGKATIDGKPLTDFVSAWAKSETGKAFVLNGNSGGGAAGGGAAGGSDSAAVNPWKPGSINLTQQGRILRENPELAARLKREAGVR